MPRIARITAAHYPHHVTQRGNNQGDVFFEDKDRRFYIETLEGFCEKWRVQIWAYCLMSNHVHLLAVPEDKESLARCIGGANLRYTQYINHKYGRSGRLWQNRFFSAIVEKESYLWQVARYIEQNPMKAQLVDKPQDYPWSSCEANLSGEGDDLVSPGCWLTEREREAYGEFLMACDAEIEQKIRRATASGRPMGTYRFIKKLEIQFSRRLFPGKAGRPRKTTQISVL